MPFVVISSTPATGLVAAGSPQCFYSCAESREHPSEHAASGDPTVPLVGVPAYVAFFGLNICDVHEGPGGHHQQLCSS